MAPVDLVLARPPPSLLVENAVSVDLDNVSPANVKKRFLTRLKSLIDTAVPRLQQAQRRYKANFEKRIRRANQNLRPGQYVFLEHETRIRDADGNAREGKLYPKAVGPFKILERGSHVVILDMAGERESVSLDRVTLAPTPPGVRVPSITQLDIFEAPPATPGAAVEQESAVRTGGADADTNGTLQSEQPQGNTASGVRESVPEPSPTRRGFSRFRRPQPVESVYERIVAYDPERGYKLRWYQCPPNEDTWEPRTSLPHNLVARYHRTHSLSPIASDKETATNEAGGTHG